MAIANTILGPKVWTIWSTLATEARVQQKHIGAWQEHQKDHRNTLLLPGRAKATPTSGEEVPFSPSSRRARFSCALMAFASSESLEYLNALLPSL